MADPLRIMEPSSIERQPRRRHLKPRDGHTARFKGQRDDDPVYVTFDTDTTRIDKHTVVRPATVFDDYKFNAYHSKYHKGDIPLNKANLWKDVIDVLEENAIGKRVRRVRDSRRDKKAIDYVLPVTGERIIRDSERKPPSRYHTRFFNFMGKKYDTTMIYYSNRKHSFEPYGRFKYLPVDPTIHPIKGKMKLKGNQTAIQINQRIHHTNYAGKREDHAFRYPLYEKDFLYTEVDFGKDVSITHLSMMGRSLNTGRFPVFEEAKEYGLDHKYQLIFVVERDAQYVTKFEVQYRVHSSKKWISAGDFTGNNDRLTEHRIQFETPIVAQFFRIIPITYNGSPSMNFQFFTSVPVEEKDTADAQETVTYSLINPSEQHYLLGGAGRYGCNCSACKARLDHNTRRTQNRSEYSVKNLDRLDPPNTYDPSD